MSEPAKCKKCGSDKIGLATAFWLDQHGNKVRERWGVCAECGYPVEGYDAPKPPQAE